MDGEPERQVPVHVDDASTAGTTHVDLPTVRSDGPLLRVAGDETAAVERLTAQEADVEGLVRCGDRPRAIRSHSLERKPIRPADGETKTCRRSSRIVRQANRYVLVRLPVDPTTGLPAREVEVDEEVLTAAVLGAHDDDLVTHLRDDDLLAPFLSIPSKDNGLDVEGVAVHHSPDGTRLHVGLRGSILRGWAVLLELRPVTHREDPHRLVLAEFDDGSTYRTHLLDLRGLGVRDLCPDGDDLLVLTGPSMGLSGPIRVHRWAGACTVETADVVRAGEVLVVLDSPAPERHTADGGMLADVWRLPARHPDPDPDPDPDPTA